MKAKRLPPLCISFALAFALLTGCALSGEAPAGSVRPAASAPEIPAAATLDVERRALDRERREEIIAGCMALAELCAGELEGAEAAPSEYFPYEEVLARETLDALEELLAAAGYAVLDTDGTYPAYLRNSEGLTDLARSAADGESARQSIVSVTRYGGLDCSLFEWRDGELWHICASVYRADDGSFLVSEPYIEAVRDFGCVGDEFFYYRIYPFDTHWDACVPVRLTRADEELYGLNAKYVRPLGYQSTNVFLVDWSSEDWGELSFNDVFEYLYLMRTGGHVDAGAFEYAEQLECCLVPAALFEETLLPYFDISAQELRSRAGYLSGADAYPWQPVTSSNIVYFPTLTPELRACRDNGDGSVTLTVDVLCFDEKCFPLFTHELTVAPGENGNFKYLANELVFVSEHSQPNALARMDLRRRAE